MIGKFSSVPVASPMSGAQPWWSSIGSTLTAMTLVPRSAKPDCSAAVRPSSVVHTGVKSAGWLNNTAQLSAFQSWKVSSPSAKDRDES